MTDTEKAIEILDKFEQYTKGSLRDSGINNIMPLLKEAMREKLEREKGCSFCNDKRVVSFCATSYHSSLEPITIIEDLYFGFCPHCGRKLNSSPTD